jgi:hypothetical protein
MGPKQLELFSADIILTEKIWTDILAPIILGETNDKENQGIPERVFPVSDLPKD